jgi:hypothetical protein
MKSNKTYHYFFRYSLLAVSILLTGVAIGFWFSPESIAVNGSPGTQDISTTLIFGLFGVLAFLIFLVIRHKFAIVELGNQAIKIKHRGEEKSVSWLEVEEIKLVQFVSPPLYKLKIKNNDETILFNTEPNYASINGFVTDLSDMGDFVKKKKQELGI